VTKLEILKWIHLLAAAVWTGGLIVLAFLVGAIRKQTDDREVLRAVARRFGVVSWTALAVAIITGFTMYTDYGLAWSRFQTKGTLIAIVVVLALVHQFTAKKSSPAVRGILQLAILIVSVLIFGAAVALV
jgi:putative copper export protein